MTNFLPGELSVQVHQNLLVVMYYGSNNKMNGGRRPTRGKGRKPNKLCTLSLSVCISVSIKPVEDQMGGVSSAERRNSGGASGITAVSQSVRPPPHASQTPRADLFSLVTNIVSPGANDIASSALPQRHVIHTPLQFHFAAFIRSAFSKRHQT